MLRKIRIVLGSLMAVGITLLFLDFTGTLHRWLGWMAKVQFLPAAMALNALIVIALILLTLVFGRVYCSVICPLGVFQDMVSWLSGRRKGKKARFSYVAEHKVLRYSVFALFVIAIAVGLQPIVALLAPYSSYGRMVQGFLAPLWQWGNNLLATLAERADSYAFYSKEVWLRSLPTLLVAGATLIAIVWLAWKGGRTYCNSICPVGTILSFFSRFALLRPVIDADKCRNCRACERKCKASCISIADHSIDWSRCVDCFDCIGNCKFDALKYRFAYGAAGKGSAATESKGPEGTRGKVLAAPKAEVSTKPQGIMPAKIQAAHPTKESAAQDPSRRAFLASAALLTGAATLEAQSKKVDGGFAAILDKKKPGRTTPLTPFGSLSVKDFYNRCTACQLCVAECPNDVLRPSQSLAHFMQPELSYERGYCRPECVRCSELCPSGAILPITPEEKTTFHIGLATVDRELCIVEAQGLSCGNCSRHCPTGAIRMTRINPDDPDSLRRPVVNEARCIGCGACENLCPSRPYSAIHVNGISIHTQGDTTAPQN